MIRMRFVSPHIRSCAQMRWGSSSSTSRAETRNQLNAIAEIPTRNDLAIVLLNPENPVNVGAIARTCVCFSLPMHLVSPSFPLDDPHIKRVAMAYWRLAHIIVHPTWNDFLNSYSLRQYPKRFVYYISKLIDY